METARDLTDYKYLIDILDSYYDHKIKHRIHDMDNTADEIILFTHLHEESLDSRWYLCEYMFDMVTDQFHNRPHITYIDDVINSINSFYLLEQRKSKLIQL